MTAPSESDVTALMHALADEFALSTIRDSKNIDMSAAIYRFAFRRNADSILKSMSMAMEEANTVLQAAPDNELPSLLGSPISEQPFRQMEIPEMPKPKPRPWILQSPGRAVAFWMTVWIMASMAVGLLVIVTKPPPARQSAVLNYIGTNADGCRVYSGLDHLRRPMMMTNCQKLRP